MHKAQNIFKKINVYIALIAFTGSLLLIGSVKVSAATPPLDPGCYNRTLNDFTKVTCSNEGQARTIVPPQSKCYLISLRPASPTGVPVLYNKEIGCSNGELLTSEGSSYDTTTQSGCEAYGGVWRNFGPNEGGGQRCDETKRLDCEASQGRWEYQPASSSNGFKQGFACSCSPLGYDSATGKCTQSSEVTNPPGGSSSGDREPLEEAKPLVADSANGCDPRNGSGASLELTPENCSIIKYLVVAINFLSAVAGMVIVGSIIFSGYQYMTARDNSGQIESAKKRIIWTMVALMLLIFGYGFLNWLVPGGVL
jgi:hypothetical protein